MLTTRDSLLALGVSAIVVGVILRGFVRSNSRAMALRRQHELHLRKLGEPTRAEAVGRETRHLERWLPRYAAGFIVGGAALVLAAFFRS